MPPVSRFSTEENLAKIVAAEGQLKEAISEAKLAAQAGIPGADQQLAKAEAAMQQLQTIRSTYFPQGVAEVVPSSATG